MSPRTKQESSVLSKFRPPMAIGRRLAREKALLGICMLMLETMRGLAVLGTRRSRLLFFKPLSLQLKEAWDCAQRTTSIASPRVCRRSIWPLPWCWEFLPSGRVETRR